MDNLIKGPISSVEAGVKTGLAVRVPKHKHYYCLITNGPFLWPFTKGMYSGSLVLGFFNPTLKLRGWDVTSFCMQ